MGWPLSWGTARDLLVYRNEVCVNSTQKRIYTQNLILQQGWIFWFCRSLLMTNHFDTQDPHRSTISWWISFHSSNQVPKVATSMLEKHHRKDPACILSHRVCNASGGIKSETVNTVSVMFMPSQKRKHANSPNPKFILNEHEVAKSLNQPWIKGQVEQPFKETATFSPEDLPRTSAPDGDLNRQQQMDTYHVYRKIWITSK